jgi:Bax protein
MRVKSTKKIKSKIKNSNQLELTFRENIKNKKNTNNEYNKSFNAISRIFLSSFVIVSFFYITPIFINFADKNFNNKEFTNNSKKILAYTLNSKNQKTKDNENLKEEDLLFDIFSLNDLETDSVRLSAATIKQLFEDTNYSLKDVRKNKLVKPVALTLITSRN